MKVLILCAFWLQEPPKEVVQIIEKMCGHLQDPMKEVWEHRLPIKLSRQCLWCIQITRNSFDFLWMHSWWHNHWWFLIGMLRSFEEPQGSKQKMSGLHTEVQEEVAWHQRLWGCQLVVKLITCLNSVLSIDWASCFAFLFHVPLMLLHVVLVALGSFRSSATQTSQGWSLTFCHDQGWSFGFLSAFG